MSFLVSNHNGSFALFGINSRYNGVFFWENNMFRVVADIRADGADDKVVNNFWKISRGISSYWFAHRLPVFFYECKKGSDVFFDCKLNYDNRIWGRHYQFFQEGDVLFVRFDKKHDDRESDDFGEYGFWLALYGCKFDIIEKWVEHEYSFDKERSSLPFSRWLVLGCRASGSFALAFSESKEDALKLAKDSWSRRKELAAESRSYAADVSAHVDDIGVQCAQYSLACLQEAHGLFAGLPWFHNRWARDELISVRGLLLSHQKSLARVILFDWLNKLLPGKLPGTLTSTIADAGWLFVRFEDFLSELSDEEKGVLLEKIEYYVDGLVFEDGLVVNDAGETWMDSLDRSGARIEIQALTLAVCRLSRLLGRPRELEEKLKESVLDKFWTGKFLKDGSDDKTVRPNLFIAAYVYPELLEKSEWLQCFDFILPKLWLDWGGLSTIDVKHKNFVGEHSGEDPSSYHNGDSWFWVNNLAAMVLHAFDAERYDDFIKGIFDASTEELLYKACAGHHSELSSAVEMRPGGCLAQAWSAAMYVELYNELM